MDKWLRYIVIERKVENGVKPKGLGRRSTEGVRRTASSEAAKSPEPLPEADASGPVARPSER